MSLCVRIKKRAVLFFTPDIQLCPSRSDDYIPKLYYETNKFSAFDQLWTIKAKVIGNEKCATRSLSYQLILKGKQRVPIPPPQYNPLWELLKEE